MPASRSTESPPASCLGAILAYGLTSRPTPWLMFSMPWSTPASAIDASCLFCCGADHRLFSLVRRTVRWMLKLHRVVLGLKEIVLKGIAISAVQPVSSRVALAYQMPSQSSRMSSLSTTSPSTLEPSGLTAKKKPLRRSKNGSMTSSMRSSESSDASRRSCLAMMRCDSLSVQRTPK